MGIALEVALIGDPAEPFLRSASEEEWNRPYAERKTIPLEVAQDDRLQDVLTRAAERMGLEPPEDAYTARSWMGKALSTSQKTNLDSRRTDSSIPAWAANP